MSSEESKILDIIKETQVSLVNGNLEVKSILESTLNDSIKLNFLIGEFKSRYVLGVYFRYKSNFTEAVEFQKKALKIALNIKDRSAEASIYKEIATLHDSLGDRKKAITYNMKALAIHHEDGNDLKKARMSANIGQMFLYQNNFDKAEQYLLDSWEIFQTIDEKSDNWIILRSLGSFYSQMKVYDKAEQFFKMALENAIQFEKPIGISFGYRGLSKIETHNGKYQEAIILIDKSLKIIEEKGIDSIRMSLILMKAQNLISLNKSELAKQLLLDNLKNIKQDERFLTAHNILCSIFKTEKNFELALYHYEKEMQYKESLGSIETTKYLETTEAKYQNKIKENEKEILRLQKVELEQKVLRSQLNPHFFFNSLNSINKFIVDNEPKSASRFLATFSGLMRKTLENSEESFITIEDEIDYLTDYLSIEQLRLNFSFQFKIKVDDELETDFIKIPTMVLQPYVENCIKHGVVDVEKAIIKINFIYKDDENLTCIIEDNGKGRGERISKHKSMGTKITEKRLEVLSKKYHSKFKIDIEDLKNEHNISKGTKIILNIPIVS